VNYDASLLNYFLHASLVVKGVMLVLIGASIFSWTYIFQRGFYLRRTHQAAKKFEHAFWSGEDLSQLYTKANKSNEGLEAIFHAGFKEFQRFRKQAGATVNAIIENTKRAMHVAQMREQDKLETHLPFLAIVGSTSPYVGLFGTVWGIMQAFTALANVQQATISMVAPGIAEALIATALGLFAAIPAVIAYNRFLTDIGRLMNRYDAFKEEFINILIRQTQLAPARLDLETAE
jgi:biopolymer transport protein TolQ